MPDIRIVPLGAGQDVGRSCILVSIGSKNVMFDCGMHMGYNDERRFPDFNYITGGEVSFILNFIFLKFDSLGQKFIFSAQKYNFLPKYLFFDYKTLFFGLEMI